MKNIYDGLTILMKYNPNAGFSATHDEIYAGDDSEISDIDKKALKELGWTYEPQYECWSHFC